MNRVIGSSTPEPHPHSFDCKMSNISKLISKENRDEALLATALCGNSTIRHLCIQLVLNLLQMDRREEAEMVALIALDKRNAIVK